MTAFTPFDIAGKISFVTGSSRGIGLTLATGLAKAGTTVVLHGLDRAEVDDARDQLAAATGATVHSFCFDLTDPDAVTAGIADIIKTVGTIDILVNNAGIQRRAPFTEFPVSDWNDVVAVNLTAAFLVSQQVAKVMVTQGHGKIINIGSVQSQLARPSITPYAATKGGIVMLTKGLCADLAGAGIQSNALAPGYIETDLTASLVADEEFSSWVRGRTPAARWGKVEDLVGTLLFLASPAADFINGQVIYVDGGMTSVV